jgi:hypothetical protein
VLLHVSASTPSWVLLHLLWFNNTLLPTRSSCRLVMMSRILCGCGCCSTFSTGRRNSLVMELAIAGLMVSRHTQPVR